MNYKKKTNISLNYTEINHLLFLMKINEREGVYFGPLDKFICRSAKIEYKLKDAKNSLI